MIAPQNQKPYPDFPLNPFPARNCWRKRIAGRAHYFGTLDDPQGALLEYQRFLAEREAEQKPTTGTQAAARQPAAAANGRKPYPDFPLTAHNNGQWIKKVRGRQYGFGPLSDPQGSLANWLKRKDAILAGLELLAPESSPNADVENMTWDGLLDRFLAAKVKAHAAGDLRARSLSDYRERVKMLRNLYPPLRSTLLKSVLPQQWPDIFREIKVRLAKKYPSKSARQGRIVVLRSILKFAKQEYGIELRVSDALKSVKRGEIRRASKEARREFTPAEILAMLKACDADPDWKTWNAVILLCINGGMEPGDALMIRSGEYDRETGMYGGDRLKVPGNERAFRLWPETLDALAAVAGNRQLKDGDLIFVTRQGNPWIVEGYTKKSHQHELRKVMEAATVGGHPIYRKGRGAYALRHTFQTVADDSPAKPFVVRYIMGHVDPDEISEGYREWIKEDKLDVATDYVRTWLFGEVRMQQVPRRGGLRVVG
jgi:hypothetical protein